MTVQQQLSMVLPLLIISAGSLVLPLLEVFVKGNWPRGGLTAMFLLAALAMLFWSGQNVDSAFPLNEPDLGRVIFNRMFYVDHFGFYASFIIIFGAVLALLLSMDRVGDEGIESSSEYYSLFLMATAGALIFVSAAELITLFLGLEIMSMALYCMCGSALSVRSSSESALKYFLLGSFSSAFLLYGIALIYGLTGSTHLDVIARQIGTIDNPVLYFGLGLVLVGLVFKIGGVPLHFWAPDVYQGAPTSVTAFMACVIKASAVTAALRVLWMVLGSLYAVWAGAVWMIAVLTMSVGNLLALRQRSLKRMLAYSSIAHAGYILVAFLCPPSHCSGCSRGGCRRWSGHPLLSNCLYAHDARSLRGRACRHW